MKIRTIAVVGAVFRVKALLRGPGLNQRAVHCEVLIAHELFRPQVHFREEALRHGTGQKPVAVLGKYGMVPHRIVHAQTDEPAK